jgi:hypothetical protein
MRLSVWLTRVSAEVIAFRCFRARQFKTPRTIQTLKCRKCHSLRSDNLRHQTYRPSIAMRLNSSGLNAYTLCSGPPRKTRNEYLCTLLGRTLHVSIHKIGGSTPAGPAVPSNCSRSRHLLTVGALVEMARLTRLTFWYAFGTCGESNVDFGINESYQIYISWSISTLLFKLWA